jgi:hypothetical protein
LPSLYDGAASVVVVVRGVVLRRLGCVMLGVRLMTVRGRRVMGGLGVLAAFVLLGGEVVMLGGFAVVFGGFAVMLCTRMRLSCHVGYSSSSANVPLLKSS